MTHLNRRKALALMGEPWPQQGSRPRLMHKTKR